MLKKRSRRLARRLLAPAGALLAMLAFAAPGASAEMVQHHYAGVDLQPGKYREFAYDYGVIGNRAIGESGRSVCQWVYRMWSDSEQKTCGVGSAGTGFNQEAWWGEPIMGRVYNNASVTQRVDGYYWTKYDELGYRPRMSGGFTAKTSGILTAGQDIESRNWKFRLAMQPDGNAVVYNNWTGKACWHTHTVGNPGAWAALQPDGNFVIYSAGGAPLFNTGTNGNSNASMVIQDDGNLVIYRHDGTAIWATSWITGQLGC